MTKEEIDKFLMQHFDVEYQKLKKNEYLKTEIFEDEEFDYEYEQLKDDTFNHVEIIDGEQYNTTIKNYTLKPIIRQCEYCNKMVTNQVCRMKIEDKKCKTRCLNCDKTVS